MEIKPKKQKKAPPYPILEYYAKNPEMLSKNTPARWIKNKYVATSLAAFVLFGTANNSQKVISQTDIIENKNSKNDKNIQKIDKKQKKEKVIKIAPIFSHGEGVGAIGCIVENPPVFISEDEAKKIILEALKGENLNFDTTKCPIIKFKSQTYTYAYFIRDEILASKFGSKTNVKLKMDAYNNDLNLVIQYISSRDYEKFRARKDRRVSVQYFGTKKVAEILNEELKKQNKINAVVFYDPILTPTYDDYREIMLKKSKEEAKEIFDNWNERRRIAEIEAQTETRKMLLAQVEDFIKWLKEEGILEK